MENEKTELECLIENLLSSKITLPECYTIKQDIWRGQKRLRVFDSKFDKKLTSFILTHEDSGKEKWVKLG